MSDLKFYSYHGCKEQSINCVLNKLGEKNINLPCIILVRKENWNDHGFYSHFKVYYSPKLFEIYDLGITKIIEPKYSTNKPTHIYLPEEFYKLSENNFLSRGTINFYNQLKKFTEIKDHVLKSINDIHYKNLTREKIIHLNKEYEKPLDESLFRDDLDLDISSEYSLNCCGILNNIKDIASNIDDKHPQIQVKILKKLLYGSIITSLETYLGDAFKFRILNDKNVFKYFLQNYPLKENRMTNKNEMKYKLSEINQKYYNKNVSEFLDAEVKEIMDKIIFHNVKNTFELYKEILFINLDDLFEFNDAVQKRHYIFHKNGFDVTGNEIIIESSEIISLANKVLKFIDNTEHKFATKI